MGGDTTATPGPLTLSVTAFGTVATGQELRRSTARAGDLVAVSGTIGDAALGLAVIRGRLPAGEGTDALVDRQHLPQPRVALGQRLVGLATACMDVSDGLAGDLGHICEASGLGAVIEAARVPLSPPARTILARDPQWLTTMLTGGEDFELLFTLPPERESELAGSAGHGDRTDGGGERRAGSGRGRQSPRSRGRGISAFLERISIRSDSAFPPSVIPAKPESRGHMRGVSSLAPGSRLSPG